MILSLQEDGTYKFSHDNWGAEKAGRGNWTLKQGDIVLRPAAGEPGLPITRFRPSRKGTGGLIIIEPDGKENTKWLELSRDPPTRTQSKQ